MRADFPILAEVHGKPLVYLDNAATPRSRRSVIDRCAHTTTHEYANIHRGVHYLSERATDAYEAARGKVRALHQRRPDDEIVFTRGATEAINLVAQTFGRAIPRRATRS